jgi:hypothetical protein
MRFWRKGTAIAVEVVVTAGPLPAEKIDYNNRNHAKPGCRGPEPVAEALRMMRESAL